MPLPEQAMLELDAMDAALRGESVDPDFAEVAELALMLAATRPALRADRAIELDRRFEGLNSPMAMPRQRRWSRNPGGSRKSRPLIFRPAFGAGLAMVVALVVVVVLAGHRGGASSGTARDFSVHSAGVEPMTAAAAPATNGASSSSSSAVGSTGAAGSASSSSSSGSSGRAAQSGAVAPKATGGSALGGASSASQSVATPTPHANGRKIIQSSELTLSAPGSRVATVSQELFDVVGAEQGIVKHSQVNSGGGASANFTLQIPAANLAVTLARLDQLEFATVASSTSSTSDVNSQYLDDQRALADAKALRSSLLTQLESATTTASIDSIKAQIQDAESTIASDETKVNGLNGRIAYSSVTVQIDAGSVPVTSVTHTGGFTISQAAHDALKVLTAVGGGALIALAVIVPLGLVVALGAWVGGGWRRRRREQALDAA